MAWIELHQALFSHRKTVEAAEILDIPEVYVVGHLAAIWTWALDNAPEGRIKARPRIVERVAQWPGGPGVLLRALIETEFLHQEGEEFIIHDWLDYAGRLIERRQKNTERMRGARAKTPQTQLDFVRNTCDAHALHVQGLPNPTIPNQTRPDQTNPRASAEHSPEPALVASAESVAGPSSSSSLVEEILRETDKDPARAHWRRALQEATLATGPRNANAWRYKTLQNWLNDDGAPPRPGEALLPPGPPVARVRFDPNTGLASPITPRSAERPQ